MPITKFTKIDNSVCWVLWKIEENLTELEKLYNPNPSELKDFNSMKVDSRRMESYAARLALRYLLGEVELANCEVYKDEFGKPHVEHNGVEISISHAKGYGAAAINLKGPVGIDIEYPRNQITKIAHKFLHPAEVEWAGQNIERLTKIWSAKEALYKLHGRTQLIFAEQLIVGEASGQIIESDSFQEYDVVFADQGDFLISIAF